MSSGDWTGTYKSGVVYNPISIKIIIKVRLPPMSHQYTPGVEAFPHVDLS